MAHAHIRAYRAFIVIAVLSMTVTGMFGASVSAAVADVTEVTGSAYGYFSDVSLFGGPSEARGPEPTVTLAQDAANSPQDASVDSASAVYGPAQLLRAGPIELHAEASLGVGGAVTTSSRVEGDPDPEVRPGPFLFDEVDSTCSADGDGVTGSATVTNGVVETRYDPVTQEPVETVPVPDNPEPGHTVEGTIDHVGDRYRIVFNEQTTNPDGSLTVNAAHMYLLGDIAVGELIIGQSICGLTATPTADTEDAPETTDTPTPTPTPSPEEEVAAPPEDDEDGGVPLSAVGLGLGVLLLIAIVVGVLLARRGGATDEV